MKHLALIFTSLTAAFLFAACSKSDGDRASHSADAKPESPTTWTCSMHPQIQQPGPGDCPICGMDLIPLEEEIEETGERTLSMSESAKALAAIDTSEVVRRFPDLEIDLVGKLDYDTTRLRSLTARFPARVERLFVNYEGIPVKRGDHLAEVYSPQLLSAQRELLIAYRNDPDGSLTAAAREKLRLWDLLPEQIEAILESGAASDRFELRAPMGGIVIEKFIKEGDYVETGERLFRIADLSELWLRLEAYESDLVWLRFGQTVSFTVEAYPGERFQGRVAFIDPIVDPRTRTVSVRVNVANGSRRLKPGMFARGTVRAEVAERGRVHAPEMEGKWISPMHPEVIKDGPGQCDVCGMDLVPVEELGYAEVSEAEAPLVVPSSAVLRTGKRAVVYVEQPGADRPTFEGREIVLGPRAGEVFLVESGLEAGERVVTSGAFKIDSALQIQAKPSMMSEARDAEPDAADEGDDVVVPGALLADVLPHYLALQEALAADDFAVSKETLQKLMRVTGHEGALARVIHDMLAAEDLDGVRRPHFETLSDALIAAIEEQPEARSLSPTPLYRMHCPMVYDDRGADWLQATDELRNPYFGDEMLYCGEVEGSLQRKGGEQ